MQNRVCIARGKCNFRYGLQIVERTSGLGPVVASCRCRPASPLPRCRIKLDGRLSLDCLIVPVLMTGYVLETWRRTSVPVMCRCGMMDATGHRVVS